MTNLRLIYSLTIVFGLFFSSNLVAKEIILDCMMNYGISGENDETDIEFKNMVKIDEYQTIYLDIENNWLFNQSIEEYKSKEISENKFNTTIEDSLIFSVATLKKDETIIRKHMIELNRYNGFIKYSFETNYEKIYRTGYCKLAKKKIF